MQSLLRDVLQGVNRLASFIRNQNLSKNQIVYIREDLALWLSQVIIIFMKLKQAWVFGSTLHTRIF
jgi:hypothetical protein